jgi:2-oxoglutarate ferredoxin oxidoreductase subunit alpha
VNDKMLMKGNEAFAEAAIRAGARYYFGYPITPQNEIPEYMSRELPKIGGTFVQAESELAAINMAYGGALTGKSVFVSSSSPGIALMQEGISFACSAETPMVMLNVSRGGPGVGGIQPGQADYRQATKGGGNGDYRVPVFAPSSIQETVDIIYEAFEISDRYRNPVMILVDGMLGQMMEPVIMPASREPIRDEEVTLKKPWAAVGHENKRERNVIRSLRLDPAKLEEHVIKLESKYQDMRENLVRYESLDVEDAEIVFVAFGTMARIVKEAKDILKEQHIKAGLIRPISLWPFPNEAFDRLNDSVKVVISSELSMGQMLEDVQAAVKGRFSTDLIYRSGGMVPTPSEVAYRAKEILEAYR